MYKKYLYNKLMEINDLTEDILKIIFNNIIIKTSVKYIPYGDGEQNYSIFYKKYHPFNSVNQYWNNIFSNKSKL